MDKRTAVQKYEDGVKAEAARLKALADYCHGMSNSQSPSDSLLAAQRSATWAHASIQAAKAMSARLEAAIEVEKAKPAPSLIARFKAAYRAFRHG